MDTRIAIFEDNDLIRDALTAVLDSREGFSCCGAFEDGKRWQQNIMQCRPHLVLMDIEMPGLSGIELTGLITREFPEIKVLIQTVFNDSEKIFKALCAGASGYILKNEPPQKYLEAIEDILNGGAPMSAAVAKKTFSFFNNKNVILVAPENEDYHLSNREEEVLRMLMERNNHKAIAEKMFISYETVRTHIKNIYKKLQVNSRSEAVMKAIQQGI